MAVGVSKISSMNSLFNDIYEDTLYVARQSALMPSLVTNYSATGMTDRKMGIYPQSTAETVAEGDAYSNPLAWTKTLSMTITPFKVKTQVLLTDERIATDPEDAKSSASREMGSAIATKIDADLCALFSSFTTDIGTAGSALTIKRVAAGLSILRDSNVQNPVKVVLHAYHWFDIWVALGQPAATEAFLGDLANQAMKDYFVGNWLNMSWYTNNNIATDLSLDAVSGMFHQEALAMDSRKAVTMEPARDADRDAWKLNMSAWYGKQIRRATYGIALTADATQPTGV